MFVDKCKSSICSWKLNTCVPLRPSSCVRWSQSLWLWCQHWTPVGPQLSRVSTCGACTNNRTQRASDQAAGCWGRALRGAYRYVREHHFLLWECRSAYWILCCSGSQVKEHWFLICCWLVHIWKSAGSYFWSCVSSTALWFTCSEGWETVIFECDNNVGFKVPDLASSTLLRRDNVEEHLLTSCRNKARYS